MTEIVDAVHKGRRVLKCVEPEATIAALAQGAEDLRQRIELVLDDFVEADRESCPGIPPSVLRNLRTAKHFYGLCLCRWLLDEREQC